jgi:hypothetical protein
MGVGIAEAQEEKKMGARGTRPSDAPPRIDFWRAELRDALT